MGRTIIAEENVRKQIDNLFGKHKWQIGLIVGQITTTKDFIVHLAKSPSPVEDEAEVEIGEEDNHKPLKQTDAQKNSSSKLSLTDEIDEQWITEHARQVNRMLPGGLNVIGVFVFCSPEIASNAQTKLRQCVFGVHKVVDCNKFIECGVSHSQRILLHICSSTRKITCRTMNIADNTMTVQPAEWKFQTFIERWNSVRCISNIDVRFHIPVSSEKSRLEIQILHGLQRHLESIWHCVAAIDGNIVDEDEFLLDLVKSSKGKAFKERSKVVDVKLYFAQDCENDCLITQQTSLGTVSFIGKLFSQSYLHTKATKGEAVRALKCDIIRSILSRLQLLCEEAEVNNLYQVENWSLVSPARVFIPLANSAITFCDYIFRDEQNLDSLQRFSELLSITAIEEDLLFLEKFPGHEMAVEMGYNSCTNQPSDDASTKVTEKNNYFVFIFGALLAIVAATIGLISTR